MPRSKPLHAEEAGGLVMLGETECTDKYGPNCWDTKCCVDEGFVCIKKVEWYAQCRPKADAVPGFVPPHDPDKSPWNGTILEPHKTCASATDDCGTIGCCTDAGYSCFVKNEHFSNCNASCTIGVSPADPVEHQTPWSCDIVDLSSHGACTLPENASKAELWECCKKSQCSAEALTALGVDEQTCVADKCSAYDTSCATKRDIKPEDEGGSCENRCHTGHRCCPSNNRCVKNELPCDKPQDSCIGTCSHGWQCCQAQGGQCLKFPIPQKDDLCECLA